VKSKLNIVEEQQGQSAISSGRRGRIFLRKYSRILQADCGRIGQETEKQTQVYFIPFEMEHPNECK
jgi:hypothetical protein